MIPKIFFNAVLTTCVGVGFRKKTLQKKTELRLDPFYCVFFEAVLPLIL